MRSTLFLKQGNSFFLFLIFSFSCTGSYLLDVGFLRLQWAVAPLELRRAAFSLRWSLVVEHGFSSRCPWPQQPWPTGSVAPRQAGSSRTRDWTAVLCIARQLANHGTTREARESASFLRGRDEDKDTRRGVFSGQTLGRLTFHLRAFSSPRTSVLMT